MKSLSGLLADKVDLINKRETASAAAVTPENTTVRFSLLAELCRTTLD